ncbi:hypothetical protein VTK73DRAFT_158 [Phialemonium thermophilum]|uniref:Uncharacterized protein n=1 Tax=Phialemonium thermophilum TaxID=223376 RepID=A0ABR3VWM8_9PEZI
MSSRNALMFAHEMPQSDVQRQHACGACGHIMIPGRGGTSLRIESRSAHPAGPKRKKPTTPRKTSPEWGPSKIYTCGYCDKYTRIKLPAPAPISRRRRPSQASRNPSTAPQASQAQKLSANASSKKRAKSRKAGLQALVEQSQTSRSAAVAGLGLSLADFMKK